MTKTVTRRRDRRWIGGVCGGLADYFGIDATIPRVGLVIVTLLGAGSPIIAYVVAWVIMPARPAVETQWTPIPTPAAPATSPAPAPPSA